MNDKQIKFFSEVALPICSSLKIELAMVRTIAYISQYMPADEMYMTLYDSDDHTYRIIAHANRETGEVLNKKFDVPERIWKTIEEFDIAKKPVIVNDCVKEPVISSFFPREIYNNSSCIILPLDLDSSLLGVLDLFARGNNRYSIDDAELLATVAKPFAISLANARKYLELNQIREDLANENRELKEKFKSINSKEIIGKDTCLKGVFEYIELVAPYTIPILLLGETGTGKEIMADFIHSSSPRRDGPLVKVNCGSISPTLLDSELFGYEKGSFTGAAERKKGKFERANHGTIFLDEIGELTAEAQLRMLRVLQEKEIERLGGSEPVKVDIRVISATHRNLNEMVKNKEFREDLMFRLNVFPITIPPLRDRKTDIPLLVDYFLREKAREMGLREIPKVPKEAINSLVDYDWPGNVRELQNIVERALILQRQEKVLSFNKVLPLREKIPVSEKEQNGAHSLDDNMAVCIRDALKKTEGRISGPGGAAALLGINPSTLRHRMRKLGLR